MPDEISFERTIEVHDCCLCLHVQRAARVLARRFDEALRPLGLTNGQFSLLMALNQPMPPSIGAVAHILAMDRTTLTAALKPLERRGLLSVAPDGKDRRSRRLSLTAAGRDVLGQAYPIWRATHGLVDRQLGPGVPARLRQDLGRLA